MKKKVGKATVVFILLSGCSHQPALPDPRSADPIIIFSEQKTSESIVAYGTVYFTTGRDLVRYDLQREKARRGPIGPKRRQVGRGPQVQRGSTFSRNWSDLDLYAWNSHCAAIYFDHWKFLGFRCTRGPLPGLFGGVDVDRPLSVFSLRDRRGIWVVSRSESVLVSTKNGRKQTERFPFEVVADLGNNTVLFRTSGSIRRFDLNEKTSSEFLKFREFKRGGTGSFAILDRGGYVVFVDGIALEGEFDEVMWDGGQWITRRGNVYRRGRYSVTGEATDHFCYPGKIPVCRSSAGLVAVCPTKRVAINYNIGAEEKIDVRSPHVLIHTKENLEIIRIENRCEG